MKNKKITALISGAVGVCMLTTAAVASYQTANGYDALKKSILNTIDYTNCTVSAVMAMEFDGEEFDRLEMLHELALDSDIVHTYSNTALSGTEPYLTDIYRYGGYIYVNNSPVSQSAGGDEYYSYPTSHSQPNLWDIEPEDRDMANKMLRFAELASDTVVGDLRSNFVCTEDSDDSVSYSITLDSVQIPEIVNAGLSMVFSMQNSYSTYTDENGNAVSLADDSSSSYYYTSLMGNDPILDSLTMNYTVNKDGTFRDGTLSVAFTGNGHTMTFNISCDISDVGTTSVATLDEIGASIISGEIAYDTDEVVYDTDISE